MRSFYQMVQLCEQNRIEESSGNTGWFGMKSRADKEREAKLAAFNAGEESRRVAQIKGPANHLDPGMDQHIDSVKQAMVQLGAHMKKEYGTNPVAIKWMQQINSSWSGISKLKAWWEEMKVNPTALNQMKQDAQLGQTLGKGFDPKRAVPAPGTPNKPIKDKTGFDGGASRLGIDAQADDPTVPAMTAGPKAAGPRGAAKVAQGAMDQDRYVDQDRRTIGKPGTPPLPRRA